MSQEKERSSKGHSDPALSIAAALEVIRSRLSAIREVESVPLDEAGGRILAAPVVAPADVPLWANSAMDGYALRAEDLAPARERGLPVSGEVFAGRPFAGRVESGTCVRIMTGAVVPDGVDTVIIQEDTERQGDQVRLVAGDYDRGSNVRPAGEDVRAGALVFAAGRRLRVADVGLLATLGKGSVTVIRRVRVAIFSTGDELRPVGESLQPGQIHDSNRYTLRGLLGYDHCEIIDLGIVPDDLQATRAALERAAREADLTLSTAGVSVGDADFVRAAVSALGEIAFWGIAIKPGHPLAFGRIGRSGFFGLAGNPVSMMVNYLQIVRPALDVLSGISVRDPRRFQVEAGEAFRSSARREEFPRGVLRIDADGVQRVYRTGHQGSALLSSMSLADCLICLPRRADGFERGEPVWVEPLDCI
jgi:molybdopterin molybdotransferase